MSKSPDAFRTISEVAEDLDIPQHVLRFWETRFMHIKPLKRGGGRRYYRPDDIDLLRGIRHLLYGEGYTIKGVQRILKEDGVRFVQSIGRGEKAAPARPVGDVDDETNEEADEAAEIAVLARQTTPHGDSRLDRFATLAATDEARPRAQAVGAGLAAADIDLLKSALDELLECQRVLNALNAPAESNGADEPSD